MKITLLLLAPLTAFSSQAASKFECSSPVTGENEYSYKIIVNDNKVQIQQSSMNARYALIAKDIFEITYPGPPTENLTFTCNRKENDVEGYTLKINVYKTIMTIHQSSRSARYRVLAFELK